MCLGATLWSMSPWFSITSSTCTAMSWDSSIKVVLMKLRWWSWTTWRWSTIDSTTRCSGIYRPTTFLAETPCAASMKILMEELKHCRWNSLTWRLPKSPFVILETVHLAQCIRLERNIVYLLCGSLPYPQQLWIMGQSKNEASIRNIKFRNYNAHTTLASA